MTWASLRPTNKQLSGAAAALVTLLSSENKALGGSSKHSLSAPGRAGFPAPAFLLTALSPQQAPCFVFISPFLLNSQKLTCLGPLWLPCLTTAQFSSLPGWVPLALGRPPCLSQAGSSLCNFCISQVCSLDIVSLEKNNGTRDRGEKRDCRLND